ncbi:MAG: hydantoinase/oxoprolinase family protein, partial [Paenibacillus sp.]|nr:hydantoinase/oxoprolinase family protein [Paenibacillus sp.]
AAVDIGGIRTNFRMPDILSIGLGGGTIVRLDDAGGVTVGPDSVGYELTTRARIFGGDTLTTTDVAVKLGRAVWPGTNADAVDEAVCLKVDAVMQQSLEDAIDRMKTSADPVDVILVGGGSLLVPETLAGASRIIRPDNYDAANAIGAALGEVSGESERIYSLDDWKYDDVMQDAKESAVNEATAAGANPETVQIVSVEDIPIAYLPGNALLVKVKAAGKL